MAACETAETAQTADRGWRTLAERAPIRWRLLLLALSVAVPFLALVAYLAVQGVNAGRASIRAATVEEARFRAADLDALIDTWRQTLSVLATTASLRDHRPDEANRLFEELLRDHPYLVNVSALDPDLTVWAAAQPQNRGQRITGPQSERIRQVLEQGQTDVSERVALAVAPEQRTRLVFVRQPVRDRSGQVIGLLQLGLPLDTLHTALRLDAAAPERPVAIVHADGTLLVRSGDDQVWAGADGGGVFGGQELPAAAGVLDVQDSAGEHWLVAYQRASSLPWYALVATRRFEAFAPLRQFALSTALTVLVVVLVAVVIGGWLGRGITQPIGMLVAAAGRFAACDLSHRVTVAGSHELDRVAAAFNQMAAQLQVTYAELEQRVQARTADLEAARRELVAVNAGLQETVARQVEQLERANQLRRYLSPRVAELLVSERASVGTQIHRRELSVLFTDIRGFTNLSEDVEPEDLVDLLNAFLAEMTQAVFDEGGTLDKYLGDGLMAFFGDPISYEDHADRAVRAALAMRERLAGVQQRWFALGQQPLSIGVGIVSGFVTVGAIGSPERLEYTVIGNNVNLASRLVGVAGPGEILCNAKTAAAVERWAVVHDRGPGTIRGRLRPVTVFEVAGRRDDRSGPPSRENAAGPGQTAQSADPDGRVFPRSPRAR